MREQRTPAFQEREVNLRGIKPQGRLTRRMRRVKRGQIDTAIRLYESAIRDYPFDAAFFMNLSLCYSLFKSDFPRAEQALKRAVALEPKVFRYQFQYALTLMELERWGEARSALRQAQTLKRTPEENVRIAKAFAQLEMLGRFSGTRGQGGLGQSSQAVQ